MRKIEIPRRGTGCTETLLDRWGRRTGTVIFTGGYQFIIDAWIMFSVGDDATPSLLCTA